jgi:hypothetical protein
VGVQATTTLGLHVPTPAVASNSSISLFSPVASPVPLPVNQALTGAGFVKLGTGYMRVKQAATGTPVSLADLSVSEVMYAPLATLPSGEWVELWNRSASPVDLTDWQFTAATGGFAFDGGLIPAGGFLVIGASTDPAQNDDAGVAIQWPANISLPDVSSQATLSYSPTAEISISWSGDGGTGRALELASSPGLLSSGPVASSCEATTPFGYQTPQQLGTPRAPNACSSFPYTLSSIPGNYQDISDAGVRGVPFPSAADTLAAVLTLPTSQTDAGSSGPPGVLLFGTPYSAFVVQIDGFMTPITTQLSTTNSDTNKTTPTAAEPIFTIAPYWDDLWAYSARGAFAGVWYKRMAANEDPAAPTPHWIIQWNHLAHDPGITTSDLNFQVKFFDNGVIEYHYGLMDKGSETSDWGNGQSATIWLENPAGNTALPFSVNTAGNNLQGVGIRYTPL